MQVSFLEIISKNFCIVLSSPSGAGKTSISKKLLLKDKSISLSISCTTRPMRKGELNKKDYNFIFGNNFKGRDSSVGQSVGFITRRSRVQISVSLQSKKDLLWRSFLYLIIVEKLFNIIYQNPRQ